VSGETVDLDLTELLGDNVLRERKRSGLRIMIVAGLVCVAV
jgi:hypothetical protein